MTTVQEYLDYLYTLGFSKDKQYYNYLDSTLTSVDIHNPNTNECVWLMCESTEEWDEFLESIETGTEIEYDLNQHIVNCVHVEGQLCTERGFYDNENHGIILVDEDNDYHTHKLTDESFKKAVWIQAHASQHMIDIIKCHLANIEIMNEKMFPILAKYNFYEDYNSLVFCRGYDDVDTDSNITSTFVHPNSRTFDTVYISTDVFDGHLIVSDFEDVDFQTITKEELEKEFVNRILTDKKNGKIKLQYSYMFNNDPKDNINTFSEVMNYWAKIRHNESLDDINWDNIPEKYKMIKTKCSI